MRKFLLLLLLLMLQIWVLPEYVQAAGHKSGSVKKDIVITGIVTDSKGATIPGVSVTIKGTTVGTITDLSGKFSLTAPDSDAIVVFSFVGFVQQEAKVANRTSINITLLEDNTAIDEVIVVGYGTQKKVNLTAAVSQIVIDEKISSRTVTNVSSALSGLLPGLSVQQNSGLAGGSGANLLIRGLTSPTSGSTPLIVVDNMPDVDINRIDINDIESISVLKDAAAASVYGSRGSTGVILITTKTGKGVKVPQIKYTGTYATAKPTNFYSFLDNYAQALSLHKQAQSNGRAGDVFQWGTIEDWLSQSMVDPLRYPNENQMKDWVLRSGKQQGHNISAQGSGENSNYYLSVGLFDDQGIVVNNDARRYNFRFNADYKFRKNIMVGTKLDGQWSKSNIGLLAGFSDGAATNNPYNATIAGLLPFNPATGQYGGATAYGELPLGAKNLYAEIMGRHNSALRQEFNGNVYGTWTPLSGLSFRLDGSLRNYNQFDKRYTDLGVSLYNSQTGGVATELYPAGAALSNGSGQGYKTLIQGRVEYKRELFKGHNMGVMGIYAEEYWMDRGFGVSVAGRLNQRITEIGSNSTNTIGAPNVNGQSTNEGMRSIIGRFNYSINEKYLFEATFRADGNSKFTEGNQWGYFPSVSAGWRFTEESFLKPITKVLSSGKLRASYGSLGNNGGVSRYEQLQTFVSTGYVLGAGAGTLVSGVSPNKQVNEDFTWEKTTVADIGLELGFLNNKLTAEIDVYERRTTNLIRPLTLSSLLSGYAAPRTNIGTFSNSGFEINLGWRSKLGRVDYGATLNAAYNIDRLVDWNVKTNVNKNFIGMPWFFAFYQETAGIAQTYEDIYNAAFQNNANIMPGDLLYKDLNGDGQANGSGFDKKANPRINEQRPTGNYGANLFASFKSFDVSVLLQGTTGRMDYYIEPQTDVNIPGASYPFQMLHLTETWRPDNRHAYFPRIVTTNSAKNRDESDYWLQSMDYLRFKNIQLGYNVPAKFLNRLGVGRIRVYGTAENLFTLSSWKGVDPEKNTLSVANPITGVSAFADDPFPLLKSFSFGLNIGL